ncbi:MAG: DNA translocase FtsK [Lachnospiraceae bacterium]|nr:DNA translocase FtsK [Lachnospiraceae bacterium]
MEAGVIKETIQGLIPNDCIELLGKSSLSNEINVPFIRNENNQVETESLSKISHMLIAGTTGTGKTAFIQSLLAFMVAEYSQSRLKFIIFDAKGLEYSAFNKVPHMLIPVITDLKKSIGVLSWVESEIKNRLTAGSWSTDLFIVIDDYATMSMNYVFNNEQLMRILQLGRSVGVHFWLATSIPTAKIISTELKLNIPYRVAFNVTSKSVSRMILDENGAERLFVPGGMKFKGANKTKTGSAIYIEDYKVDAILNAIAMFNPTSNNASNLVGSVSGEVSDGKYDFDILLEAGRFVIEKGKASIGMIQRSFRIGFNRAARIMDQLAELGVVGEEDGTKPRAILMNAEQFEQLAVDLNRGSSKLTSTGVADEKSAQPVRNQESIVRDSGIAAQRMPLNQDSLSRINSGAAQAFQHKPQEGKSAIDKLGDAAVGAFSAKADTDEEEDVAVFTPRPKILGKEAGLEICDDHIEITRRLDWKQIATYEFKPKRIKRVVYHAPTLTSAGYVRFELDSFEWNVIDNRTCEEKTYIKKLPEQIFLIKFERSMQAHFKAYACQIAAEAELDYATE